MTAQQTTAFGQLLAAWRRREEARSTELSDLADARFALDGARDQMRSTFVSGR